MMVHTSLFQFIRFFAIRTKVLHKLYIFCACGWLTFSAFCRRTHYQPNIQSVINNFGVIAPIPYHYNENTKMQLHREKIGLTVRWHTVFSIDNFERNVMWNIYSYTWKRELVPCMCIWLNTRFGIFWFVQFCSKWALRVWKNWNFVFWSFLPMFVSLGKMVWFMIHILILRIAWYRLK